MRNIIQTILLIFLFASVALGINTNGTGGGDYTAGATWNGGVAPTNGQTAVVLSGDTLNFDEDMTLWANGITLTINSGGAMTVEDDGAAYYLKSNAADITVNGDWTVGTSEAVPFTGTFTVDFNGAAKSTEVSATGHLYWYPAQPTNKYITITEALTGGAESAADVDTDVTTDIWADGDTVAVVDSTAADVEYMTINAGGIAAGVITFTANVTADKAANSLLVLVTRNIRVINVAASDYAITYANSTTAGNGDYIGAQFTNCYRIVNLGNGYEWNGTCQPLASANAGGLFTPYSVVMSGVITGHNTATSFMGISNGYDVTISGLIGGAKLRGISTGFALTLSGRIFGCVSGDLAGGGNTLIITETGKIDYCTTGTSQRMALLCFGTIENCGTGIYWAGRVILGNATLSNTTYDLRSISGGGAYNTAFGVGTEFYQYNSPERLKSDYFDSFDHDGTTNAYKAWCRGGIVTSQTLLPPTGYTVWYEHACEYLAAGSFPCFRQYETTVLPGTALEVIGKIRIADGEDLSADPPALQIIDKFADPLIDSTQTPLDEDEVADATGATTDWQDVSVIWANAGDSPRQVIVRMYASVAGHGDAVDVDEVWSIADYQDQIQAIYDKIPTNKIMGSSDVDDHDTDIDEIIERLKRIWAYP